MINKAHASHPSSSPIRSGFTIVELLIVIVVIAILAAISIIAYTGIQGRAKDTQRLQDMSTIVRALEVYKTVNGNYPYAVPTAGGGGFEVSTNGTTATNFLSALKSASTGLSNVPVDPTNAVTAIGTGNWLAPSRSSGHFTYFYYRYNPGEYGCATERGNYYVLGITRMDGIALDSNHPQNPGWACPSRNWANTGAWVTGRFAN